MSKDEVTYYGRLHFYFSTSGVSVLFLFLSVLQKNGNTYFVSWGWFVRQNLLSIRLPVVLMVEKNACLETTVEGRSLFGRSRRRVVNGQLNAVVPLKINQAVPWIRCSSPPSTKTRSNTYSRMNECGSRAVKSSNGSIALSQLISCITFIVPCWWWQNNTTKCMRKCLATTNLGSERPPRRAPHPPSLLRPYRLLAHSHAHR